MWTLGHTKFSLIISKRINRTDFDTFICRIITPIKLRTFQCTSSSSLVTIRNFSCNIWTSTYTLPCWWVSKVTCLLTVVNTYVILVVIIRRWRALKYTLISWIVSTWIWYRKTLVHTSLIVVISEWFRTIFYTTMCRVVSIKWWRTSRVAFSCIGICVIIIWANCHAYPVTCNCVIITVSVCVDWALSHTHSCWGVSKTFRTLWSADRITWIVESKWS